MREFKMIGKELINIDRIVYVKKTAVGKALVQFSDSLLIVDMNFDEFCEQIQAIPPKKRS